MARIQNYTFQAADTSGISNLQTGTTLLINGTYSDQQYPWSPKASLSGFQRIVTASSQNDLSGTTVTILGTTWSGLSISETVTGPNNSTVSSSKEFMTVTSVVGSATLTGVSIGWGNTGQSRPFTVNSFNTPAEMAMQVTISGTLAYNVRSTLGNIQDSGLRTWVNHPALSGTATLQDNYAFPPAAVQLAVSSGNGGSLTFRINPTGQ